MYASRIAHGALKRQQKAVAGDVKAPDQAFDRQRRLFGRTRLVHDAPFRHHDQMVPEGERVLHVVRHHQRRQALALHRRGGGPHDDLGGLGIERGGVLVEQQELRRGQDRHQQRQRLPLAAGQKLDLLAHPALEAQADLRKPLAITPARRGRQARPQPIAPPSALGERKIFLDRQHARRCRPGDPGTPARSRPRGGGSARA